MIRKHSRWGLGQCTHKADWRKGQKNCGPCHAAYMRDWRKAHPLTGDALARTRARDHARITRRRGRLVPQPCERCGSEEVQMHHDDYSKPLQVRWLCRPCHLELHKAQKRAT